jgi:hypothetical protein
VEAWQKWVANPGGRPTRVGGQAVRYVTESSYSDYFTVLDHKLDKYKILPENMYNMNEKGFILGTLRITIVFGKERILVRRLQTEGGIRPDTDTKLVQTPGV